VQALLDCPHTHAAGGADTAEAVDISVICTVLHCAHRSAAGRFFTDPLATGQ